MLFNLERIEELEDFVHESDDPILLKWLAFYIDNLSRDLLIV